ncbi:MAG: 3D domain-containing protein, partial [Candidatus Binatia bacterium]
MGPSTDWGTGVVVDPRWLERLHDHNETLRRTGVAMKVGIGVLAMTCATGGALAYRQSGRIAQLSKEAREYRRSARDSTAALGTLARSHENILAATERAPWLGSSSWAHRFTVTMYVPRSPAYGKFNDGVTATLTKADPESRIVAVDPKLIPYRSSVWVEGLGWFRAEDCGSAIKGYRLDVLIGTEREAMEYGKQDRFVIVVPPDG